MCVIGGLLYRFCPRCRGHAHRLPAAPGAMDQTVRTAIEGEKPLRYKERRGRRSQMHSCTGLTLDAVGTPTGCRLCREPWIRLSGRPSRGGGHCGARGQGREKITDALSYPSCPRCRGHAHRLPAAPETVDQTVRTAIEGEKPLRCKERRGRRSQMHSRTGLTLDAVGTPTGCRLRREPWIRLSGRPSRGGGHCGARGQGRGKITDALSYPSCPRCRPWPSPAE